MGAGSETTGVLLITGSGEHAELRRGVWQLSVCFERKLQDAIGRVWERLT